MRLVHLRIEYARVPISAMPWNSTRQNLRRMANWNARGPPDPKTPPAVLTGLPKLDDRLGLLLSGERVFANPE